MAFLLSILFLSGRVFAFAGPDLDTVFLGKMAQARSATQIQTLQTEYRNVKVLRLSCHLQLEQKTLPFACYEAARGEKAVALYDRPKFRLVVAKLDQHCLQAISAGKFPPKLMADSLSALSPNCRMHLNQAWKIQAYRAAPPIGDEVDY